MRKEDERMVTVVFRGKESFVVPRDYLAKSMKQTSHVAQLRKQRPGERATLSSRNDFSFDTLGTANTIHEFRGLRKK